MHTPTERIALEPDEHIVLVIHKHWFILFRDITLPILLFIVPVVISLYARDTIALHPIIATIPHKEAVVLFGVSFWGLLTWMIIFLAWTDYYLDKWTITTHRIIAVDQQGLFRRTAASFQYERLQDINIEINGLIATFLNFGELHAQTASGYKDAFEIAGVPDPRAMKALILETAEKQTHHGHSVLARTDTGSPDMSKPPTA